MNLDTINQEIAALPPDAQQIIFDLVEVLKKRYLLNQQDSPESHTNKAENIQDWSDFIGCMTAEPDLSRNYKTYLKNQMINVGFRASTQPTNTTFAHPTKQH